MFGLRTGEITALGAALTALFTGVGLMIAWVIHRRDRTLAGRRKPIKCIDEYVPRGTIPDVDATRYRSVGLVLYNRSDVEQELSVNEVRTRLLWPRLRHRVYSATLTSKVPFAERSTRRLTIDFVAVDEWPARYSVERLHQEWRRGVLRFRGRLDDGSRVKFTRRVFLYPPEQS